MLVTLGLCILLVFLDQLFKYLAVANLGPGGAVSVLPGILEFRYVENDGAAFSLLAGRQTFLVVVTGLALIVVAYILFLRAKRFSLEWAAFLLIFTGGVGNLIDRVLNGYVVDYINVLFMRFAVFNFADCLVVVGFALLVVALVCSELRERREKQQAALPQDGPDGTD